MTSKTLEFNTLPFGTLFCDYTAGSPEIMSFFDYNPFIKEGVTQKVSDYTYTGSRTELYSILEGYNDLSIPAVREHLECLRDDPESITVVTGQQLTVLGGPLFTLYKAITAIALSRKYSKLLNRKVIPVFWLADEDHDFPEIARLGLPFRGAEWKSFQLADSAFSGRPVGAIPLDEDITRLTDHIEEVLPASDFSEELVRLIRDAYKPGATHTEAFGKVIQTLLGTFGLVLAGSARPEVKRHLSVEIINLIRSSEPLFKGLEEQSVLLEANYHRQATVSRSMWFLLDADGVRRKLVYEEGSWLWGNESISEADLIDIASKQPERLSPNVFMRPVLQDKLLPNIAYVAGPGEVAYYAQMKQLYKAAGVTMPVIVPRLSATLIESNIAKFHQELPFSLHDYSGRIEDLHQRYVREEQAFDIQSFADTWIAEIEKLADDRTSIIEEADPTLVGTLVRVRQEQVNAVNALRQKLIRSEKNRLDVQLKRITKVQLALFPNMNLQERELAFIYPLSKYGSDFIVQLLELAEGTSCDKHHVLEL